MMTQEQEAAVERVREYLARIDGEGQQVAAQFYIWMAGTKAYWDERGGTVIKPNGENAVQLVEVAQEDPAAWDAACMLSAGLLENSEQLPQPLREFTTALLRGRTRPVKRGQPKYANLARNLYIAGAVEMLLKAGFILSRNDASQGTRNVKVPSASSIIANILHMEESGVPKIWAKFEEHVEMTRKHGPYYFKEHGLKLDFFTAMPVGN